MCLTWNHGYYWTVHQNSPAYCGRRGRRKCRKSRCRHIRNYHFASAHRVIRCDLCKRNGGYRKSCGRRWSHINNNRSCWKKSRRSRRSRSAGPQKSSLNHYRFILCFILWCLRRYGSPY